MRVAAIADLHCRVNSARLVRRLLAGVDGEADLLLLPGDLTDTGLPAEMEVLLGELQRVRVPVLAVMGNHDHESGQIDVLVEMLAGQGVYVLDGSALQIGGVGFAGTKGFCGGFGECLVQPFGEQALKTFVRTGLDEAVRLENALAKLTTRHRVAVLHYAPIRETLQGEAPELYPFLGSSRLANALDRQGVDLAVHGHAHHGSPYGRTPGNVPVHNVARFVRAERGERAYLVFEVGDG